MGPFALMDLIGHDVNEAVTRSVWTAFGHDPRFAPSLAQRRLVEAGWLGRKAGRGVLRLLRRRNPARSAPAPPGCPRSRPPQADSVVTASRRCGPRSTAPASRSSPASGDDTAAELPGGALLVQSTGATATSLSAAAGRPVIVVDRVLDAGSATAIAVAPSDGCPPAALAAAVGLFQAAGLDVFVIGDVPGLIVTRTVAMLANLAADALACRVASAADIDTAMRLGVNYPAGPLEWARQWGIPARCSPSSTTWRTGTATGITGPARCCAAPRCPEQTWHEQRRGSRRGALALDRPDRPEPARPATLAELASRTMPVRLAAADALIAEVDAAERAVRPGGAAARRAGAARCAGRAVPASREPVAPVTAARLIASLGRASTTAPLTSTTCA